jgi:hypothetical protein
MTMYTVHKIRKKMYIGELIQNDVSGETSWDIYGLKEDDCHTYQIYFMKHIEYGLHWRPTFFQRRAKIFKGEGGQEPTFCLKNNKKDTIFLKKSLKRYYSRPALAGQGGKSPSCPPPHSGRPWWITLITTILFLSSFRNNFN